MFPFKKTYFNITILHKYSLNNVSNNMLLAFFLFCFWHLPFSVHRGMPAEVNWQIIQIYNETVGCTDTLTSQRLTPLPWISANPQSQTRLFSSMDSLLFVSLVIFFVLLFFFYFSKPKILEAQQWPLHVLSNFKSRQRYHAVKINVISQSPIVLMRL